MESKQCFLEVNSQIIHHYIEATWINFPKTINNTFLDIQIVFSNSTEQLSQFEEGNYYTMKITR